MIKLAAGAIVIILIFFYGMKQLRRIDQKIGLPIKLIALGILAIILIKSSIEHIEYTFIGLILVLVYLWSRSRENKKIFKENYDTCKTKALTLSENKIDELICQVVDQCPLSVTTKPDQKYERDNMPYGRANAFLNLFGSSIYAETPLLFYVYNSNNAYELKEYGILVTDRSIYISTETKDAMRKKKRKQAQELTIPYSGLHEISSVQDEIRFRYLVMEKKISKAGKIKQSETYLELDSLNRFLKTLIKSQLPFTYCFQTIVEDADEPQEIGQCDFAK